MPFNLDFSLTERATAMPFIVYKVCVYDNFNRTVQYDNVISLSNSLILIV